MKSKLIKPHTRNNLITYILVAVVFGVVQAMQSGDLLSNKIEGTLVPICYNVILAVSLNLTVGILGELSLGHAGFMCVGAYSSAIFTFCMQDSIPNVWIRFPIALLIGTVAAALAGFIIGIPVLRLNGDYLAIVTLAFGEIIRNLFNAFYVGYDSTGLKFSLALESDMHLAADGTKIINGSMGIIGMPRDSTFAIGAVLVLLVLVIALNLIYSRTGRAVMSIRDNRIAAESIGINVTGYKLIAFTISAALAGIGGVLFAHNFSSFSAMPKNFGYNMSIMFLVYVVLGGMGNMRGSVIAASILYLLPEMLRGLQQYRMLIYAVALIVIMIFSSNPTISSYKDKYVGMVRAWFKRLFTRRPKTEVK